MTMHPNSYDADSHQHVVIRSRTPWAIYGQCDFFEKKLPLSPYIQALVYELARLDGKKGETADERYNIAANYAENSCPVTSFIPFRIKEKKDISVKMSEFAEKIQWPEIFKCWLPELIIAIGKDTYTGLRAVFEKQLNLPLLMENKKRIAEYDPARKTKNCYRHCSFGRNGKNVDVVYVPYPLGGFTSNHGLPSDLEKHSREQTGTPFRQFIESIIAR